MGEEEGKEPHQHKGNTLCNKTNYMFEWENLNASDGVQITYTTHPTLEFKGYYQGQLELQWQVDLSIKRRPKSQTFANSSFQTVKIHSFFVIYVKIIWFMGSLLDNRSNFFTFSWHFID